MSTYNTSLPHISSGIGIAEEVVAIFCSIKNISKIRIGNDKILVTRFLKFYFDILSDFAVRNGGMVNKYVGETALIIFPLPPRFSPDEYSATISPFRFVMSFLQEIYESEFKNIIDLNVSVGMDVGLVMNGDIGYENLYESAFIGDVINTANRLKGLCSSRNVNIIISRDLYSRLPGMLKQKFRYLGPIELKGKQIVIHSYAYANESFSELLSRKMSEKINDKVLNKLVPLSYFEFSQQVFYEKFIFLCCDIRNFTPLCESYNNNSNKVFGFLQKYFSQTMAIAIGYGGRVYKLLGDEIIVFFPVETVQDYAHKIIDVLHCGIEFLNVASHFNVANGVGIALGDGMLFDVGMDFFERPNTLCNSVLLSDALGVATRLEALNKASAVKKSLAKSLIISRSVYEILSSSYRRYFAQIFRAGTKNIMAWGCSKDPNLKLPPVKSKLSIEEDLLFLEENKITNTTNVILNGVLNNFDFHKIL